MPATIWAERSPWSVSGWVLGRTFCARPGMHAQKRIQPEQTCRHGLLQVRLCGLSNGLEPGSRITGRSDSEPEGVVIVGGAAGYDNGAKRGVIIRLNRERSPGGAASHHHPFGIKEAALELDAPPSHRALVGEYSRHVDPQAVLGLRPVQSRLDYAKRTAESPYSKASDSRAGSSRCSGPDSQHN